MQKRGKPKVFQCLMKSVVLEGREEKEYYVPTLYRYQKNFFIFTFVY